MVHMSVSYRVDLFLTSFYPDSLSLLRPFYPPLVLEVQVVPIPSVNQKKNILSPSFSEYDVQSDELHKREGEIRNYEK